ncbi:RebB family R body protein [Paraneptunicella aestuarii]|uniref:RebB family R body protein n=1 Tax=Paraneptunicella aestuarii TaxID=2831148 RepID=UPI001E29B969|nr:RebB family R body protein [Paraneptunicella aestuarii]UAA37893.1 RebB family R body protein [Paraneptunicella aestuarii]
MPKVNEIITDSVTQTNTQVIAGVPSNAMSALFAATGLALSNAGNNATTSLQYGGITSQAATVQGVNSLTALATSSLSRAAEEVIEKG